VQVKVGDSTINVYGSLAFLLWRSVYLTKQVCATGVHPVLSFSAEFGRNSANGRIRLYFDLEHSSTHSVDFLSDEPAR
jgi:hypothetical protein